MKYLVLFLLFLSSLASAQKLPSIAEKTKDLEKHAGFVNYFWDDATGKIWLEISKFSPEMLYQQSLPAGLGSNDIGLDRGLLGDTRIIQFSRIGRKLLMIEPNYSYRAVTNDTNEKKAVEQSFAQSTLWGFAIEAETDNSV